MLRAAASDELVGAAEGSHRPLEAIGARELALVFGAGGLGACARVLLQAFVDSAWAERLAFVGTLSANLAGCLLIGFCAVAITHPLARLTVLGGFLGGFTTYSAFALFTAQLGADAKWGTLSIQLGAHLVGGVLAVLIGSAIARAAGLGQG